MQLIETAFPEVKVLVPTKHGDERGFFCETYNCRTLAGLGVIGDFVQDNQAFSAAAGTVRGLHFQIPPMAQAKLVRVLRGSILDVVVDLRRDSPRYGRHVALRMSAEDLRQIFVPIGFAHGFCTLEPNCEILYKVTNYYSPAHDRGINWLDPALGIDWPIAPERATLSARDRALPALGDLPPHFQLG